MEPFDFAQDRLRGIREACGSGAGLSSILLRSIEATSYLVFRGMTDCYECSAQRRSHGRLRNVITAHCTQRAVAIVAEAAIFSANSGSILRTRAINAVASAVLPARRA